MAGVTLTEQIGAMALIDELRHRQLVVQEHLNLPERRKEVAGRIREFYQSKKMDVDDDLVEQGVRAYFDRRLSFEAPVIGSVSKILSKVYITKARWWKPAAGVAALLVGLAAAGQGAYSYIDNQKTEDVRNQVEADVRFTSQLKFELDRQHKQLSGLKERSGANAYPVVSHNIQNLEQMLARASELIKPNYPATVSAESRLAAQQAVDDQRPALDQSSGILKQSTIGLAALANLLDACESLVRLRGEPDYQAAKRQHAILVQTDKEAVAALDQTDGAKVVNAVASLQKLAATAGEIDAYADSLQGIEKAFSAMPLRGEEALGVKALVASAKESISKLDTTNAASRLANLRNLLAFAETPLALNIVDRTGTKSGVERNYNASNGKSWFLVVEATDSAGQVVAVPVKSAETGRESNATVFGVRVSRDEYERVKADKKQDGHVDDRLVGRKGGNTLAIQFNNRIGSAKPDTITEW